MSTQKATAKPRHKVVVIGGGFGGLLAVTSLRRAPVDVALIDRRNHHLFQPLLYQVATGALSPANIAAPLRGLLHKQKNAEVLLGEVVDIDPDAKQVMLRDGDAIPYDSLIVAAGSTHSYFGHDEWEPFAPGLKTLENATLIRGRVLSAFERAERAESDEQRRRWLTFVVVGGGPTGVEMAGAVRELASQTLRNNFRHFDPADARVILVEGHPRILPPFDTDLSNYAGKAIQDLGVELILEAHVSDIQADSVRISFLDGREETIAANTVLWGAGVQASPLGEKLAERIGVETDRAGRVPVGLQVTVDGHDDLYVIGDLALFQHNLEQPLPALAPVAMQQGQFAAERIKAKLAGKPFDKTFAYHDRGTMATIGRCRAVADIFGKKFTGTFAWLVWLLVHLMLIVQFESRILILMQWAWNYCTRNRSARLITDYEEEWERFQKRESVEA